MKFRYFVFFFDYSIHFSISMFIDVIDISYKKNIDISKSFFFYFDMFVSFIYLKKIICFYLF